MDRKNLFSYTVHPDRIDKNRSTDVFDENAYTTRLLSPDLKAEKDELYDAWLEAKAMREARESNVGCIAECLSAILCILFFVAGDLFFELLPDTMLGAILSAVPSLCFILLFVFLNKPITAAVRRTAHRLYIKKHPETDMDEKALDPRLSETVTAARAELGIPHHAWSLDILPYRHGVTSAGETYEIRPRGIYDNILVSAWREGQVLFLSDEDIVMRIPLSEISEVKRVKKQVKFKSWYKFASPDTAPYNEGKVDMWFSSYTCKGSVEVILRDGYRLLIPSYDAATLRHILGDKFTV